MIYIYQTLNLNFLLVSQMYENYKHAFYIYNNVCVCVFSVAFLSNRKSIGEICGLQKMFMTCQKSQLFSRYNKFEMQVES